jgi:phosphoribosyl-AMP cyclohydrolase
MSRFAPRGDAAEIEGGTSFSPKFGADGLLPVVTVNAATGEVLMVAYMNEEALARSIETGEAHYWSRSRNKLWRKGETSGFTQRIVQMRTDCDQDTILLAVALDGGEGTCHTGRRSCFYRSVPVGAAASPELELRLEEAGKVFDPEAVYGTDSHG